MPFALLLASGERQGTPWLQPGRRGADVGAAPRPIEPKVEREAAALHEAEKAECEAGATKTATTDRVAEAVAGVAGDVASTEDAVAGGAPGHAAEKADREKAEQPVAQPPAMERHGAVKVKVAALLSSLGMGSVSGGFSIYGFTIIFGGYLWPIVAMGCFLEACKLSAVAWLGHHHGSPSRLRPWLVGLVAVLMALNAIGFFGFLVRAHVAHQAAGETTVAVRLVEIEGKIMAQAAAVADIDRQLAQLDGAIEKGISRGKINGAMQLANEKRGDRTKLQVERLTAARLLVDLKVEKAKIEGERRTVEADLGPVKYFAEFFGAGDETVMRYFILVLAALLDPAAVLLLLAAAAPRTASAARS